MVAAVILGFTACKKGGGNETSTSIKVKDETQLNQEVAAAGKTIEIGFEAAMQWSAAVEGEAAWMTVSPTSGEAGEFSLAIVVSANDTEAERSGAVSVVCGDDKVTVNVRQLAEEGTEPEPTDRILVKKVTLDGMEVSFEYDSANRIVKMLMYNQEAGVNDTYTVSYGDGTVTSVYESTWGALLPGGSEVSGRSITELVATLNADGMVESYEGSKILYRDTDGSGDIESSITVSGEMTYSNGRLIKFTAIEGSENESLPYGYKYQYDFQWTGDNMSKVSYAYCMGQNDGEWIEETYAEIGTSTVANNANLSVDLNNVFAYDDVLSTIGAMHPFAVMGLCGERSANMISTCKDYSEEGLMYEVSYIYDVDENGLVVSGSLYDDVMNEMIFTVEY